MSNQVKMCSFCGVEPAEFRHEIDSRVSAPWEDADVAPFYACHVCHALIMTEAGDKLIERVASLLPDLRKLRYSARHVAAADITAQFWALDAGIYERLETQ